MNSPGIIGYISVFILLVLLVSCKPRADYTTVQSTEGSQASGPLTEQSLKALEALPTSQLSSAIDAACKGVTDSLYQGKESDGRVRYSTTDLVDDPIQVNWDAGTASFNNGRWKLTNDFSSATLPECIRGESILTTRAFLVAINCAKVDPCPAPEYGCANGQCVKSDPPLVAFNYDSRADAGVGGMNTKQLALTDVNLTCGDVNGRFQLKSSVDLGVAVEDVDACEQQKISASGDLVCAWSGSAFIPYSISNGKSVALADDMGTKDLKSCSLALPSQKENLVCGWNGLGYSPVRFSKDGSKFIGEPVKMDLASCQDNLSEAKGDLICTKSKNDYLIYNVKSGLPLTTKVSFTSRNLCLMTLKNGAKLEAKVSETSVPNPDVNPDQPSQAGLGLLGVGYTLASCHVPEWNYHIAAHTKDSRGVRWLNSGCQVDTLYSWGPWAKVQYMVTNAGNGANWSGRFVRDGKDSPLFATNSPIASFGYGDYAIRIKLKWDIRYKVYSDSIENYGTYESCRQALTASEIENTILVRYWSKDHGSGLDYIICGPGPIHSWSYGTREHLAEVTRETNWVNANNYKDYELYYKKDGVDQLMGHSLDGHSFSSATWTSNMSKFSSLINSSNSGIYFSRAAGKSATTANHFNTKIPIYFNPD